MTIRKSLVKHPQNLNNKSMTKKTLRQLLLFGMFTTPFLVLLVVIQSRHSQTTFTQQAAGNNTIVTYDQLPEAQASSSFTVKANGQDIFVEKYKDISYARFAFSGMVALQVTGSGNLDISPKSYNIQGTKNGTSITFSLTQPRKLIINPNSGEKLFIFADPLEDNPPKPGDPNVVMVPANAQTAQIQQALDGAAGKILYFPKGKYLSGSINIPSNVSMYLSSGALLQATTNTGDFNGGFVKINNSTNTKLFGRGVIDGSGAILRGAGAGQNIIRVSGSKNITVNDIILRDAGTWTVRLTADNASMTNVKIINDQSITNGDGIDPDAATNITIDAPFIYTTDDCFAVKAKSGATQPTTNVFIKNSVCWTKKSALKLGTETTGDITNVTFDGNDVVHADRVMSLYEADGHTMSDIKYLNTHSEVVGGDAQQKLFDFTITNRSGGGFIKNVIINDYTAYSQSPKTSVISGLDSGHQIEGVAFKNLIIAGKLCKSIEDANISTSNATGITFSEGPAPTSIPPTNNPTNNPTQLPTNPPAGGGITINMQLLLHGIGKGGDNANPGSGGNPTPIHTTRTITATLINASGQPQTQANGTIQYNSASGNFTGNITISSVPAGAYLVKIKVPGFLQKQLPTIVDTTKQTTFTPTQAAVVTGDVTNDNTLSLADYIMITNCFGSKINTPSCQDKTAADINDDGKIDGIDYNLFLRELSTQNGA